MDNLLRVENIKKHFKTSKGILHAVDGVSFDIKKGETLGVVGESGCGKSTLGRTIIHLHEPSSGKIYFEDEDISDIKGRALKEKRKDMQMIFQDPYSSLNPRMTVSEIIGEPLVIYRKFNDKAEYTKKVKEIMDTVGLAERLYDSYPHELDGGRRQRIGIGRALVFNPKFIVCDEPVSALDVSIQAQILNLMQDLQDMMGLTYLFITHDMSVVKHISNDILVMYLGVMIEKANSKELFKHSLHPYTKALLAAVPVPVLGREITDIPLKGEISSPINMKPGCRFAKRCTYAKEKCMTESPVVEEIMPEHFVACHYVREINNL